MFTAGPDCEKVANKPDPCTSDPTNGASKHGKEDNVSQDSAQAVRLGVTEHGENPRVSTLACGTANSSRHLFDVGDLLSAGSDPAQLSRKDLQGYLKDHFKPDPKYENFEKELQS